MNRNSPPGRNRPGSPDWKPDTCEAPGCSAKHPTFSKSGSKGPWLCHACYVGETGLDKPPLHESIEIEKPPAEGGQPPPGRLL